MSCCDGYPSSKVEHVSERLRRPKGAIASGRGWAMKVAPFHSKLDTNVYHNQSGCTVGDNIESYNKVQGTGGKRLCAECARLG